MKTILIIEDNPQNSYMMRYLLEKNGFSVITSKNGLDGIRMAADSKPDCILLDIQLPGMDGYQVAQTLKSSADLASIPVIAVTSYAMTGDREKALAAGANGYLEKPIDTRSFVDTIRMYIEEDRTAGG